MDGSTSNGAGPIEPGSPLGEHAYGRAALILAESLMHALVEKGVISREDFIEIVEGAGEVENELATANGSCPASNGGMLLPSLATAFKKELGR